MRLSEVVAFLRESGIVAVSPRVIQPSRDAVQGLQPLRVSFLREQCSLV